MENSAPEEALEQVVIDRLYRRLDELIVLNEQRLKETRQAGAVGTHQNRSERDSFASMYEDRIALLKSVEDRLCFGRLDFDDATRRYVGRIGLSDAHRVPILTDWRAPASEAFYRATPINPMSVTMRRHISTQRRQLTALEDEVLQFEAIAQQEVSVRGQGALLAALNKNRTGKMNDIVATIQAEQDEIIRADLNQALVVQGGPGSGKTAVALHRAAYLLYTHRNKLEKSGVLLIGPNRVFLNYIDQVLPSLGENGVVATTLGQLLPDIDAQSQDSFAVAKLKASTRWVGIISRAILARQRVPQEPIEFRFEGENLQILPGHIQAAITKARRTGLPHNEARNTFVKDAIHRLARQYGDLLSYRLDDDALRNVTSELLSNPVVRRELNIAWFPISAERLVADLYAKPHRLLQAAPDMNAEQRKLLHREHSLFQWTTSDIPILDEAMEQLGEWDTGNNKHRETLEEKHDLDQAQALLSSSQNPYSGMLNAQMIAERYRGGRVRKSVFEQAIADRSWTFGHVIIDEAQELTDMDWRMLIRRCPTRSFTIVGDVSQNSHAGGSTNWKKKLDRFFDAKWQLQELTVNYRTPKSIMKAAVREAARLGLQVPPILSARDVSGAYQLISASSPDCNQEVLEALHELDGFISADSPGSIAIIALDTKGLKAQFELLNLKSNLVFITPLEAKGLEFDGVILIDSVGISEEPKGANHLFVAYTRATKYLRVINP